MNIMLVRMNQLEGTSFILGVLNLHDASKAGT